MHTTSSLLTELDTLPVRWEVAGTLAAPVAAVAALLLAVGEGRVGDDNLLVLARSAAARQGTMTVVAGSGAGAYHAELAGPVEPVAIEVDQDRSMVAVQSWYAGVHAATACPAGTRVTHRVHRVLPDHPGFAAGIAEIGLRARMSRDLRQVLDVIADRLGCQQPTSISISTSQGDNAMPTFNTPEPIAAVVDIPAGRVRFVATDRADTAVEIGPADAAKSRDVKVAEQTRVEYAGGVLRIDASAKNQYFGPSGAIDVTVGLPAGSRVEVTAASVECRTVGRFGDVAIAVEHGSVDVDEAASARITNVAGDVSVGRLDGPAEIRTSKGDIRIAEAVRGTVVLRTDAGEIEVGAATGVSAALDAGTSNGRIHNSLKNSDGADAQLTIHATTAVGDIVARSL